LNELLDILRRGIDTDLHHRPSGSRGRPPPKLVGKPALASLAKLDTLDLIERESNGAEVNH
jgi:hypothetical protein